MIGVIKEIEWIDAKDYLYIFIEQCFDTLMYPFNKIS